MFQPAIFTNTTARHSLPFLFAGQAQKEFTLNEAFARIDMLLQPVILGEATSDPVNPASGDCYLVASGASGGFAGQEENLASWDGQQWTFATPFEGMTLRERGTNAILHYASGWQRPAQLDEPAGGSTIDIEARDAIAALLVALRDRGIIS